MIVISRRKGRSIPIIVQLHRESIIIHNIMSSGVQGLAPLLLTCSYMYVPLYKPRGIERLLAGEKEGAYP